MGSLSARMPEATVTTILFADLVRSTERIQQLGDEHAQALFESLHGEMTRIVEEHGGEPLLWLGDGMMAAFGSCADAVRSAAALQRAARWCTKGLDLRIGINVGEILREQHGAGYFGTPVVIAARLCARAEGGRILASSLVAGLLAGRKAFRFRDVGALALKGIAAPVPACEIDYEDDEPTPLVAGTPFVGRIEESSRLDRAFERVVNGVGALVFVTGDAGIGKTRVVEEFARRASAEGARVLRGRCFEGEGQRPFGPFAEAIDDYVASADVSELAADLGPYGAQLFTLAPHLRARLPEELPPLPALSADAERERLLFAVLQLLLATAKRAPVVLVVDDLHWADAATVALFRHVGRFAREGRLLLLGTYRDVEIVGAHPLVPALAALRREAEYERISLSGLDTSQVAELLDTLAEHQVPPAFAERMRATTGGNPFFLREFLTHLVEEGVLPRNGEAWNTSLSLDSLGIPEGVRQVLGRRFARLSADAAQLLTVGAAFDGAFPFEWARRVADLEEGAALDALDEAIALQLVASAGGGDRYLFSHDLVRQTLYTAQSPARRVRLHRRIAEQLERAGTGAAPAGEIVRQYHRSRELPGAERGAAHALAAADHAERAGVPEEAAEVLRAALELLPESDAQRPRLLARRALALARSAEGEEAARLGAEAAEELARTEGSDAAANYLADLALFLTGYSRSLAWQLVERGLHHIGDRRDIVWARLADEEAARREAADPENPGIPLDSPLRREITEVVLREGFDSIVDWWRGWNMLAYASREEALRRGGLDAARSLAGDLRGALPSYSKRVERTLALGNFSAAVINLSHTSGLHAALGDLDAAEECTEQARRIAAHLNQSSLANLNLAAARAEVALVRGTGFAALLAIGEAILKSTAPDTVFARAVTAAHVALGYAWSDREGDALAALARVLPAVEKAPGWAANYTRMLHLAVESLWLLGSTKHVSVLERNLREKTLSPDFRCPHADARLSLARLCALQARTNEAIAWFAKAREVLDAQGARPLRAITDHDEALMYLRRGAAGDAARAAPLLEQALARFRELGMPGWEERVLALPRSSTA